MVKPPFAHMAVYGALAIGAGGYGTWALLNSTVGYPYQLWYIDMMDSTAVKAYEQPMRTLPEGVVSRTSYRANIDRAMPDGSVNPVAENLKNPLTMDEAALKQGEWGYKTYCAPCHASTALGMGPVTDNSDGKKRFPIPGVALVGAAGALKLRSDGYVYGTIRNGGALMPAYSWALSDQEIWSIIGYLRTLPESTYVPPVPTTGAAEG